jgi:hypothetical protein
MSWVSILGAMGHWAATAGSYCSVATVAYLGLGVGTVSGEGLS